MRRRVAASWSRTRRSRTSSRPPSTRSGCCSHSPATSRRRTPRSSQGRWERSKWGGVELADKVLGVLGFGRIGRQVARRALGLQMKVVAYDPFVAAERFRELGVESCTFDEVLARAEFLTLHLPLTDETRGAIDEDAIAKMRDGVRLVNAARGDLVVDDALVAALESGKVAGAAIDVFVPGAVRRSPAPRAERRRDAASRRLDRRGAGPRRRDRRRAGRRGPRGRSRDECRQHPDRRGRRPRGARAVRPARREARAVRDGTRRPGRAPAHRRGARRAWRTTTRACSPSRL